VDLIVHVDPPNDHKDYLHRSGRTARAGASGVVVSLLTRDQVRAARTLFHRAGLDVHPVDASTGSPDVRSLAESGEPVVVTAAPARPDTDGSSDSRPSRRPGRRPEQRGFKGGDGARPPRRRGPRSPQPGRRAA
jgi:superfamily II DNA/RNA helicase